MRDVRLEPVMKQRRYVHPEGIPGPRSIELMERRLAAVPRGVGSLLPIFARHAGGGVLVDVDGNSFIDFGGGIAVLAVGSSSPRVVAAVTEQVAQFTHTCFQVTSYEGYVALAERLNELAPCGPGPRRTVLVNSGAEAVENAVKIARAATGRSGVVAFEHGFHGRTLLGMTLTSKAHPYKSGFGPFAPEVYRLPYCYPYRSPWATVLSSSEQDPVVPEGSPGVAADAGPDQGGTSECGPREPNQCGSRCADSAIAIMEHEVGPSAIACLVIEPVLGEGGAVVPGDGFLSKLKRYCAQNGIVFIADEVQSGFARTGRWFAIEHSGVDADIVVSAKGLGGGLPIGAVTGRAELMDAVHPGGLGSTFGGNPLSCAAALAAIAEVEELGLLQSAARIGERVLERLCEVASSTAWVGQVRGLGALLAVEIVTDKVSRAPDADTARRIIARCHDEGLIVLGAGTYDNCIRILPPLVIGEDLLDEGLGVLERAIRMH